MATTTAPEEAAVRKRRRWPWIVLVVVLGLATVIGFVLLRDRNSSAIPDEVVLGQRGLATDMRDTRYCEVLLIEGRLISPTAAIYNTFGLNDCPAYEWDALDTGAIKQEWTPSPWTRTVRATGPWTRWTARWVCRRRRSAGSA